MQSQVRFRGEVTTHSITKRFIDERQRENKNIQKQLFKHDDATPELLLEKARRRYNAFPAVRVHVKVPNTGNSLQRRA